jgi:hypothetical protein
MRKYLSFIIQNEPVNIIFCSNIDISGVNLHSAWFLALRSGLSQTRFHFLENPPRTIASYCLLTIAFMLIDRQELFWE